MKILFVGLFFSLALSAAEFPLSDYRAMEMGAKVLLLGNDLSKAAGRDAKFDAALAVQSCDAIDKKLALTFKNLREIREEAINLATGGNAGWDNKLFTTWKWDKAATPTLALALQKQLGRWNELAVEALPCTDAPSLELVQNITTDQNAINDEAFSLCVRMVKAYRKSGICGRPIIPGMPPLPQ